MSEPREGAGGRGDEPGQEPTPEVTVVWVDPGELPGGRSATHASSDPRPRRRSLVVGALVATLVLAGVLIGVALNSVGAVDGDGRAGGQPTGNSSNTQSQPQPESSGPSEATRSDQTRPASSQPPSTAPPKPRSKLAPPAAVRGRVKVVEPKPGVDDCTATDRPSHYQNYPAADCELFERATGLRTGEKAGKRPITVACQRDLKKENRRNGFGQTNTWWVWTQSDTGTWDWFRETAVKEGASDEPLGGVALCR